MSLTEHHVTTNELRALDARPLHDRADAVSDEGTPRLFALLAGAAELGLEPLCQTIRRELASRGEDADRLAL